MADNINTLLASLLKLKRVTIPVASLGGLGGIVWAAADFKNSISIQAEAISRQEQVIEKKTEEYNKKFSELTERVTELSGAHNRLYGAVVGLKGLSEDVIGRQLDSPSIQQRFSKVTSDLAASEIVLKKEEAAAATKEPQHAQDR